VVLYPAPVQGAEAPPRLVEALERAGARALEDGIELVLLVRGGGSIEDLWAFNDETLARAIRACPLPVVCGVGHETDFTIADFAADLRATTPTAAAEHASAGFQAARAELAALAPRLSRALERRLLGLAQRVDRAALRLVHPRERLRAARGDSRLLGQRLQAAMARQLARARERQGRLETRLAAQHPQLGRERERLTALERRLARAAAQSLQARRDRLAGFAAHLQHLAPQAVLGRGYAIARDAEGRILRSSHGLSAGATISVELAEGGIDATVSRIRG
jgi:exodeoxyribonuclease VII large subunit